MCNGLLFRSRLGLVQHHNQPRPTAVETGDEDAEGAHAFYHDGGFRRGLDSALFGVSTAKPGLLLLTAVLSRDKTVVALVLEPGLELAVMMV